MSITKPKKLDKVAAFVASAPDAAAPTPATDSTNAARRGRPPSVEAMTAISLKLSVADLDAIDAAAAKKRISRAAFIRQAVFAAIE